VAICPVSRAGCACNIKHMIASKAEPDSEHKKSERRVRFALPPPELDVLKPRPQKLSVIRALRKARRGGNPASVVLNPKKPLGPSCYGIIILRKVKAADAKEPEVLRKEPEVIRKQPEVLRKEPDFRNEPEVLRKEPEVLRKEPEVVRKEPEVLRKQPEVLGSDEEDRVEVVLVETHRGNLGFAKGKATAGESPLQTAERETTEECGICPARQLRYIDKAYRVERNNRDNPSAGYFVAEYLPDPGEPLARKERPPLKSDSDELRQVTWFSVRAALDSPALRDRRKVLLRRAVRKLLAS
jgi:8-oxo-dGTP pyrophosphatase MutT (NUDIX family)